jgi:hypothetical protein
MPQERETQERETKIDRDTRRRLRRWRRRAQVAAPLLAVPAVLGLLILSVDLIEYQPSAPARSASRPAATQARFEEAGEQALVVEPQSVSALSVVDSPAIGPDGFDSAVVASASVIDGANPIESTSPIGAARFGDPMRDASATWPPAR